MFYTQEKFAPDRQGYTQGLQREGPRLTKSHKGSLSLVFFTHPSHTQSPRESQLLTWKPGAYNNVIRDTHRNFHTKMESDVDLRYNPRGFQSYSPRLGPDSNVTHGHTGDLHLPTMLIGTEVNYKHTQM